MSPKTRTLPALRSSPSGALEAKREVRVERAERVKKVNRKSIASGCVVS